MRHISDELIQQYLDNPESFDNSEVERHLSVCFECREKLEQYQELYQHLSVESEVVPNETFNLSVLAAVEQIESKKKSRLLIQFAGSLSVLVLLALNQ